MIQHHPLVSCRSALALVAALALLCLPAQRVSAARPAATIPVTTTIQAAINSASDGDTISIPSGTYTESLTIGKSLTLLGTGPGTTIIQAPTSSRVITVTADKDLTLKELSVTGGNFSHGGGGIFIQNGNLTIQDCWVHDNQGTGGGAIYQSGTSGKITISSTTPLSSKVYNNQATTYDGGAIYAHGDLELDGVSLDHNTSARNGGGVFLDLGTLTIKGGLILDNGSAQNGGGAYVNNSVSIVNATLQGNTAGLDGGGIDQVNGGSLPQIYVTGSTFDTNHASADGGALGVEQGVATNIAASTFTNNAANCSGATNALGGAVFFNGGTSSQYLTITGSTFAGNQVQWSGCSTSQGGGVYAATPGFVEIQDDVFRSNSAWEGGGLELQAGTSGAEIWGTTFQQNTGAYWGGADLSGNASLHQVEFIQNSVSADTGALRAQNGNISIRDSIFDGNFSTTGGLAGAMLLENTQGTLINVAVLNTHVNNASSVTLEVGSVSITHGTFSTTTASSGSPSGIYVTNLTQVSVVNSIIASEGTGVLVDPGGSCTLDHTLWYNNPSGNTAGAGTISNTNPVPPGNPDFAADGFHLTPSSPAIDQGIVTTVTTDIDGDTRDSHPDIGVDEFRYHVRMPLVLR